jgi:RHS repeat-associated protein
VYGYDGARRAISECNGPGGACDGAQIEITRTFDRANNVESETQHLRAGSGTTAAGADQQGTQTFTYDALNRVLTSTLGSIKRAYSYDSNGNRLSVFENDELADTFVFDTTDQTISNTAGDVTTYFSYDRYGSLLSSGTSAASFTTYTFDLADRLTAITQPDGTAVVFAFDAAGRHESRTATASDSTTITDTYAYLGTTNSVLADTSSAGVARTVYAAIDSMGNRLASRSATTGGTFVWVIPDLHGNVVAQCSPGGSSITDAFRYDPYGKLIGTPASVGAIASPWRFQGRLLMSTTDSANADVYDFTARAYIPDLGTFASLDTVTGSAQNPLTLNRYLYALGNPATMVDPSGHCPWCVVTGIGGGIIGAGGTLVVDLATGQGVKVDHIVAGGAGGVAGGLTFGATLNPWYAGAAYGSVSNGVQQTWDWAASGGKEGFDPGELVLNTGIGTITGGVGSKVFGPIAKKISNSGWAQSLRQTIGGLVGKVTNSSAGQGLKSAWDDLMGAIKGKLAGGSGGSSSGSELAQPGPRTRIYQSDGSYYYEIPPGSSGGATGGQAITGAERALWYPDETTPLCSYCRVNPAKPLDHVEPKSAGGNLDPANITPACTPCNSSKWANPAPLTLPGGGSTPPSWWPDAMRTWWMERNGH